MTIWKYQLETTDFQSVEMPKGAELLCVQVQGGVPCVWAVVDPKETHRAERQFRIFGTGHPVTDTGRYIGTYQLHGGSLVFHVFEATA